MEKLMITGTNDTPTVHFDLEQKIFSLSGKSMPENVAEFYEPVITWLEKYKEKPLSKMFFDFKMEYFNTASSKLILDLLFKLEGIKENGSDVTINWYFPEDDDDLEEAGNEYSEIVNIPFNYIPY